MFFLQLVSTPRHLGRLVKCAAFFSTAIAVGAPLTARATEPTLLLRSAKLDVAHNAVTVPLHRGTSNGKTVWYVLTDVSNAAEAQQRGLVLAPALLGVGSTAHVSASGGVWNFAAAPDFSKSRVFVAGATGFPPAKAAPGATASAAYSPYVTVGSGSIVYNAPIVATGDGPFDVTHHTNTSDRVLAIDANKSEATLLLADGFADGKKVLYISTEASDPGVATIERATYAPKIGKSAAGARLAILVVVNGRSQGLADVALHGNLSEDATSASATTLKTSKNILGGLPQSTPGGGAYDPLWDVSVAAWTPAAVSAHKNITLTSASAVQGAVAAKTITGPGGKAFGPVGFAVNCPVIAVYK